MKKKRFAILFVCALTGMLMLKAQTAVDRHFGGVWAKPGAHETLGKFVQVDLPVKNTQPIAITVDARHMIWVAEKQANRVMRYDPYSGDFYPLVNREPDAGIQDLAVDRIGNVWFTQFGVPEKGTKGNALGVVSSGSGNLAEYRTITPDAGPYGIVLDPEGFVYSTVYYANRILRLDGDTGEKREYSIPTRVSPSTEWEGDSSLPTGIASDPNGIIWFCESRGNKIGRLDPESGVIREYDLPTKNSRPTEIAIDSQGYPWVTLQDVHKIARLDPRTGRVREWDVGSVEGGFGAVARTYPVSIAIDADDVVWFNESRTNAIGSLNPRTEEISKYRIPWASAASTKTQAIAIDALGSVWFVDPLHGRIGMLK